MGSALTYGVQRLDAEHSYPNAVCAAFVASDLKQNILPEDPADASRLLNDYTPFVKQLAGGAKIILLPEMTAVTLDAAIARLDAPY